MAEDDILGGLHDTAATRVDPTDVSENTLGLTPMADEPVVESWVNSSETVTGVSVDAGGPHKDTLRNLIAEINGACVVAVTAVTNNRKRSILLTSTLATAPDAW